MELQRYGYLHRLWDSVSLLILKHTLGDTNDQQVSSLVSSHDTQCSSALSIYLGMSMFQSVMKCMPMLHNSLQVDQSVHKWHLSLVCLRISSSCILKCKNMTLVLSLLNTTSPCILTCKTIISSIPMCYSKCHSVNNFSLQKISCVDEQVSYWQLADVILETSRHLV